MNGPRETTDAQRFEFLARLKASGLRVTFWEEGMLETAVKIQRYRTELQPVLSPKQRVAVDKMMKRYAAELPMPKGQGTQRTQTTKIPEPVAGKCGYLVKREGEAHQTRCGEPAVKSIPAGMAGGKLELCLMHSQEREERLRKLRGMKRRDS